MHVSTALRNTTVRSTPLFLQPTIDSAVSQVFPIEPVIRYRWPETFGHRLLRKRRVQSSKPFSSNYAASDHQVDEYV